MFGHHKILIYPNISPPSSPCPIIQYHNSPCRSMLSKLFSVRSHSLPVICYLLGNVSLAINICITGLKHSLLKTKFYFRLASTTCQLEASSEGKKLFLFLQNTFIRYYLFCSLNIF